MKNPKSDRNELLESPNFSRHAARRIIINTAKFRWARHASNFRSAVVHVPVMCLCSVTVVFLVIWELAIEIPIPSEVFHAHTCLLRACRRKICQKCAHSIILNPVFLGNVPNWFLVCVCCLIFISLLFTAYTSRNQTRTPPQVV